MYKKAFRTIMELDTMAVAEGKLAPAGIEEVIDAMTVAQDLGSLGEHLTMVIDKPPSVTAASLAKRPSEAVTEECPWRQSRSPKR